MESFHYFKCALRFSDLLYNITLCLLCWGTRLLFYCACEKERNLFEMLILHCGVSHMDLNSISHLILTWACEHFFLVLAGIHTFFFCWGGGIELKKHSLFLFPAQCNLREPVGWYFLKTTSHLMSRLRVCLFFFTPTLLKTEWENENIRRGERNDDGDPVQFSVCTFILTLY